MRAWLPIADAPVMVMLGTGPGYGSARFAAAKAVEAAELYAAGQDLEEWEHVETLAHPSVMPTIVIAAPGRSRDRAVAVAARARARGRAVVAVADAEDRDMAAHADVVLPLCGLVREEFSPLVSHVFGGLLFYEIARRLGRSPFSTHQMPGVCLASSSQQLSGSTSASVTRSGRGAGGPGRCSPPLTSIVFGDEGCTLRSQLEDLDRG
ncbi:SIS domain-containing protein [Nonomuraea fuscirosea]